MMRKSTKIVLGALVTLWPFMALLSYAVFDHTVWNDLSPSVATQWCAWLSVLASWTGTLPLTLAAWNKIGKTHLRVPRFVVGGLVNVGFSAVYMGVLYVFFLAVAFGFDHIFI